MKWIFRLGLVNIAIIIYLRISLVHQPLLFTFYYEAHGNKEWVNKVKTEAGDTPVVFENSWRKAPMYAFYSGETSFSLNNVYFRKNQYSIDQSEEMVRNKKILYITRYGEKGPFRFTKTDGNEYSGRYIENFNSYRKLECSIANQQLEGTIKKNLTLNVYNPYNFNIPLKELKFGIAFLDTYKKVQEIKPIVITTKQKEIEILKARDTTYFNITLPDSKIKKPAYFRVVISENNLYFGLNGKPISVNE